MPVTMSGFASGIDSEKIIKDLVRVERKPIVIMEQRKKRNKRRIKALNNLNGHLKALNTAAKDLYGFSASYDDKKANSSDKSILTAKANKLADKGVKKIKVLQTASTHKISTDPIKEKDKIPSGKFKIEVNKESHTIRFGGGRLSRLQEKINEEASDIVTTSYMRTSGDKYIVSIQSKVSGKKGEIKLSGDKKLLKHIGLISGVKGASKNRQSLVFDRRYFNSYMGTQKTLKQNGILRVSKDGKSVSMKGVLWQEYAMPVEVTAKDDTVFEFSFLYKKSKEQMDDQRIPRRLEMGPDEKISIKGITLHGYNVSRFRKQNKKNIKKKLTSILGVGVIINDKGKRKEKIFPIEKDAKGKQEIPIGKYFAGKKISKIILYCNDGTTTFKNAQLVTPEKKKGLLEPKNVIAKARNAKIKIDGIEIVRDKNRGITDAVKGVTLDLRRASKRTVELNITHDVEKAIKKIETFVTAYNKYLSYHKYLIKTDRTSKPGDYSTGPMGRKKRRKNGLFVGDMTIMSLENNVRRTVNNAYTSMATKPIRILPQLGVSTGKINSSWQKIKEGKLVVDKAQLKKAIIENPEGVRMFFGADSDGDRRPDTGMAFTLVRNLRPYIMSGKNIIRTKIDLENNSIKLVNERIERKQMHIKKYEEKLRKKFTAMEKAISGSKATKNWLNNQFGGSSKGK